MGDRHDIDVHEAHPTDEPSSASAPPADTTFCPLCRERFTASQEQHAQTISGFIVHGECAREPDAVIRLAEIAYPTTLREIIRTAHRTVMTAVPAGRDGVFPIAFLSDGAVVQLTAEYFVENEAQGDLRWISLPPIPGSPADVSERVVVD